MIIISNNLLRAINNLWRVVVVVIVNRIHDDHRKLLRLLHPSFFIIEERIASVFARFLRFYHINYGHTTPLHI